MRQLFRRKFGYESSEAPSFDDLTREDDIDVEVSCSGYGFTKEMENELLEEYGIVDVNDDDCSDDEENVKQSNGLEQTDESTNYTESELNSFRQQVEEEIQNTTKKPKSKTQAAHSNIQKYIESVSHHLAAIPVVSASPTHDDDDDNFEDAFDSVPNAVPIAVPTASQSTVIDSDAASVSSNDLNDIETDDLADLDPNSRQYRFKMVEKILSDARSMRSYSTSASTIAPSVIKDKIKKNLDLNEKKEIRKRCVAKGEASAVTRGRKENRNTCKEYAGWDF